MLSDDGVDEPNGIDGSQAVGPARVRQLFRLARRRMRGSPVLTCCGVLGKRHTHSAPIISQRFFGIPPVWFSALTDGIR